MGPEPEHQRPEVGEPGIPAPSVRPDPEVALVAVSRSGSKEDSPASLELQDWEQIRHREELTSLVQDRKQRLGFGAKVFRLVIVWLLFVALMLVLVAIRWPANFHLPDAVLVALLGTTTVSVIGLLATVALYLFPKR